MSFVKQLSLDRTRFFATHCPMSGANIQTCTPVKIKYFNVFLNDVL